MPEKEIIPYTYLGNTLSKQLSSLQYHRMQLSLLSDEQKVLYILKNTK